VRKTFAFPAGRGDILISHHVDSAVRMDGVDRDTLLAAGFIAGSVLLLGAVASTIDDIVGRQSDIAVDVDPRSGKLGQANASIGNESVSGQSLAGPEQTIDLVICIDELTTAPAMLGIVAAVVLVVYGFYRRYNASTSLLAGTGLVPVVWGSYFFVTNCGAGGLGGSTLLGGTSTVTRDGGLSSPVLPPEVVAGLFGVVVIAGLVFLATTTTGSRESREPEPDEPDTADVARTAGRAADRIETADVPTDNAVYRAWLEMTGLLDIESPETTAPEDFAGAAIELGLDEDHVAELTDLFRDVRYGGKSTEGREDRAVEILRRIEQSYTDGTE